MHRESFPNTRMEPPVTPMDLLASGIPLTLLLDLIWGPESADLLAHEGVATTDRPAVCVG